MGAKRIGYVGGGAKRLGLIIEAKRLGGRRLGGKRLGGETSCYLSTRQQATCDQQESFVALSEQVRISRFSGAAYAISAHRESGCCGPPDFLWCQ